MNLGKFSKRLKRLLFALLPTKTPSCSVIEVIHVRLLDAAYRNIKGKCALFL